MRIKINVSAAFYNVKKIFVCWIQNGVIIIISRQTEFKNIKTR